MARFKLTESQYRQIMQEWGKESQSTDTTNIVTKVGQNTTVDSGPANTASARFDKATTDVKSKMQSLKGNETASITAGKPDTQQQTVNGKSSEQAAATTKVEGRVITKKQIKEMKLKKLKENSELYKLSDFLKR